MTTGLGNASGEIKFTEAFALADASGYFIGVFALADAAGYFIGVFALADASGYFAGRLLFESGVHECRTHSVVFFGQSAKSHWYDSAGISAMFCN